MRPFERRLAAAEGDVAALARRLLPASAPDPSDPSVLVSYLTGEELARLETAFRDATDRSGATSPAPPGMIAQRRAPWRAC